MWRVSWSSLAGLNCNFRLRTGLGTKRTLPKGAFDAVAGQSSVPGERLRKIMMSHPTWPRYIPFLHTPPLHKDSCQFGVLLWPCGDGAGSKPCLRPKVGRDAAPFWFHILRFDLWAVLPVEPASPLQRRFQQQQQQAKQVPDCIDVQCAGEDENILKHAARQAFGKVTDAWLSRLIDDIGLATLGGAAPAVFRERLELLLAHFLPDCKPADVATILASTQVQGWQGYWCCAARGLAAAA